MPLFLEMWELLVPMQQDYGIRCLYMVGQRKSWIIPNYCIIELEPTYNIGKPQR